MLKRLRIKFIIINMTIVTAMLCIIFTMVLHFTQQNLERSNLSMMRNMLLETGPHDRPDFPPDQSNLPFFILGSGPEGVLRVRGPEFFDLSDEALERLKDIIKESGEDHGIIAQYKLRFLRGGGPKDDKFIFSDISVELDTVKTLRRNCILIGLASFFAFLGISILLARWAVKPVELAWTEQKQFVADASHELKTPLTVIMANAEFLLDESYSPQSRLGFAESILTMSRHMRSLVEELLELARADSAADRKLHQPLDLSSLLTGAALPFEALYFEKGLELQCCIDEGLLVRGRADQLRQLAEILLDNAHKYSACPGTVQLTLSKQGRQALICVANPGDEIPKAELKNIFKRFYRLDAARLRDGSFGLGLSIADSIVRAHRGKIWAESSQGENRFFVQLPLMLNKADA